MNSGTTRAMTVIAIVAAWIIAAPSAAAAGPLWSLARANNGGVVILADIDALRALRVTDGAVRFDAVPLPGGGSIDLLLERFAVTGPATRFVLGRADGTDVELDFDPAEIVLLRGGAVGYPASRVFMTFSGIDSAARIDLGPGHPRYLLTSRSSGRAPLAPGEMALFEANESPAPADGAAPVFCGTDCSGIEPPGAELLPPPTRDLQQIEMAIETDHEFYQLFGDATAAAAYVVQVYGAVSDIYVRDVNTRLQLNYVRIWDNPGDPAFTDSSDPLAGFASYWRTNMTGVVRDVAQYFSARRNLSAGGVAYLNGLCNNNSYSWCGYVLGYFVDPDRVEWANRDIMLAAHELGHNCGTGHTHDYDLDECGSGAPPTRRGSIMSYCGQGYSGGDSNHDLWFHEHTAVLMRTYIFGRSCVANDCNSNNVPDAQDIAAGTSADADADGIPDECEDCNGNGVLDPIEISQGLTPDLDANMVPDGCQSDCDGDGVVDAYEIEVTPALDFNANRILDSCEGDCDGDGLSDYNEIQLDMSLDVNRNIVLDSCEDCDADNSPDLFELEHAWNVVAAGLTGEMQLREFHAVTGVATNYFTPAILTDAQDVRVTADGRVLVSLGTQSRIAAFSLDGMPRPDFAAPGAGGLAYPAGMFLLPGRVLVADRDSSRVLEFNQATGAFSRELVAGGQPGGAAAPFGVHASGSRLLVTSNDNRVLEYNVDTGAFVRVLVAANAGGLTTPRGLLLKPDGKLLVCSKDTNRVLEYDGDTGAFIAVWNRNGTPDVLTLDDPWCIRLGPDGDVYVSRHAPVGFAPPALHQTDALIYHFDVRNGNFLRAFVQGHDTEMDLMTGFDFIPGGATDCNRNNHPDSCDIAQGSSLDCNGDTNPDECTPPCPASICSHPHALLARIGETVTLEIAAGGATGYQWRRDLIPLTNSGSISGADTPRLTISPVALGDAGTYDVVLSSPCGAVTSQGAVLEVRPPCATADFNNDGDSGTDLDIEDFFACLGGSCCPACHGADFDGDGDSGTDLDIEAFFRVLGGGPC